ncbi:HupE/UreJ family protein [Marinicellulosiphila megalodicopiae]|uniref:HupE/UreJ family protein n=1 Tax=Marinicellulosiphila megalodicopiae TaxID=2724896 RepID=UPI003BB0925A
MILKSVRKKSIILFATLCPSLAFADGYIESMNSFFKGFLNPVLVPSLIILVIASAVYLGQQDQKDNFKILLSYLIATVIGAILSATIIPGSYEILILFIASILGLLSALNLSLKRIGYLIIAIVTGALLGIESTPVDILAKDKFSFLLASTLSLYLLFLSIITLSSLATKYEWQKISLRVIGSWIIAISLLVITLSFAKPI